MIENLLKMGVKTTPETLSKLMYLRQWAMYDIILELFCHHLQFTVFFWSHRSDLLKWLYITSHCYSAANRKPICFILEIAWTIFLNSLSFVSNPVLSLVYHTNCVGETLMHVIKSSVGHVHRDRIHMEHYSLILCIMKIIGGKKNLTVLPSHFFNSCDCYQRLHLVAVTIITEAQRGSCWQ